MGITTFLAVQNDGTLGLSTNTDPNELFSEMTVQAIFDEAQAAAAKSYRGSVISQETFAFNGHPGRRFYVDGKTRTGKKGHSRFEFILAKPRMYVINVNHIERDFLDSDKAKAFFDSFKVVE